MGYWGFMLPLCHARDTSIIWEYHLMMPKIVNFDASLPEGMPSKIELKLI